MSITQLFFDFNHISAENVSILVTFAAIHLFPVITIHMPAS